MRLFFGRMVEIIPEIYFSPGVQIFTPHIRNWAISHYMEKMGTSYELKKCFRGRLKKVHKIILPLAFILGPLIFQ